MFHSPAEYVLQNHFPKNISYRLVECNLHKLPLSKLILFDGRISESEKRHLLGRQAECASVRQWQTSPRIWHTLLRANVNRQPVGVEDHLALHLGPISLLSMTWTWARKGIWIEEGISLNASHQICLTFNSIIRLATLGSKSFERVSYSHSFSCFRTHTWLPRFNSQHQSTHLQWPRDVHYASSEKKAT